MATLTLLNTSNAIQDQILKASVDANTTIGSYSLSQLLVNGLNGLASFNTNIASEVQTGKYVTGYATDGSFYINTTNYIAFFYGTIKSTGSTITKVEIDNKTNGAFVQANGSFTYQGLPFITTENTAHISNIFNSYNIDNNTVNSVYLICNVNLVPNTTTLSGSITEAIETVLTKSSGVVLGLHYVGIANILVDPFNLNNTTVTSGSISSIQYGVGTTALVSDSFTATGITNWSLNTPLNQLALNTGNDSYYLTGRQGNTVDGGTGDDVFYIQTPNNTIYGGDGSDTAVFSGTYANYTKTFNISTTEVS